MFGKPTENKGMTMAEAIEPVVEPDVHQRLAALQALAEIARGRYMDASRHAARLMFSEQPEYRAARGQPSFVSVMAAADEAVKAAQLTADNAQAATMKFLGEHGPALSGRIPGEGPHARSERLHNDEQQAQLRDRLRALGVVMAGGDA